MTDGYTLVNHYLIFCVLFHKNNLQEYKKMYLSNYGFLEIAKCLSNVCFKNKIIYFGKSI